MTWAYWMILLLIGATSQVYWQDNCNLVTGWVVDAPNGTSFSLYTGDAYSGTNSFRLTSSSGYMNPRIVTATKTMSNVTIPPTHNKYCYVIGATVKIKQINAGGSGGRDDMSGYASIGVTDQSGAALSKFVFAFQRSGMGGFYGPWLPYDGPQIPIKEWHKVEMSVTPEKAIYYIDGVNVFTDAVTRINEAPVNFQITVSSGYGGGVTEVLLDDLHVSATPTPEPFPWLLILIGLTILFLVSSNNRW